MDDPLQNNVKLIKKIEDDIEVLIMLQTATALSPENFQSTDIHDDINNAFACIQDCNKNTGVNHKCYALKHRNAKEIYPHEHINIRLSCSPSKSKNESDSSQGSNDYPKYYSSSQARLTKTESIGKSKSYISRTSSRCLTRTESRNVQENKYSKMKPEKDDNRSAVEENWKVNDSNNESDRYDRLYKDVEKIKKKVGELIKVKTENSDLQSQLASIQREKASLLVLVQSKEDSIRSFENSLDQMKCESKYLLEEKENRIRALTSENLDLAKKVKEFDMKIEGMQGEAESKEKSYTKELSKRPSAEEYEEQKCIWDCKIKEYECIITEKDSYIQEIEEKYEELEVMYGKAEEESQRSLSVEKELTNSNMALEGKLTETEKSKEELLEKLTLLEKEKDKKVSELRNAVKELSKRAEELVEVNKKLEESLKLQAKDIKKKDEEIKIVKEQSRELSDQIEVLQNSVAKNGEMPPNEASQQMMNESEGKGDHLAQMIAMKKELDEAREILEHEKIEVQKREEMILDYQEVIKKIQAQAGQRIEELQRAIVEKERMEMNMKSSFYQERRQNEILLNELTKLKWNEKQLTQQLNETLEQLSEYEMENAETEEAFAEHSHQLLQIENEVEKKTAQWYTYVSKLSQERDMAINTARAARQKLTASLTEFQKHFAVQRRVQEVLTGLLRQREYDLRIALTKIVENRCHHSVADSNSSVETDV